MQEKEGLKTRQIYWRTNRPLEPITLLIFAALAAPYSQQLLSGCLVPSAKCSWLAHDQYIWPRGCWSRERAENASFSPLSGPSPPTLLSISPRRKACLRLAYQTGFMPSSWHKLCIPDPKGEHVCRLERWRGVDMLFHDVACRWTAPCLLPSGNDSAHLIAQSSHIFHSNPYAWLLLAYWCNTHPVPWWHWAQIIGGGLNMRQLCKTCC